jgi:hypothetical protein
LEGAQLLLEQRVVGAQQSVSDGEGATTPEKGWRRWRWVHARLCVMCVPYWYR